MTKLLALLLCLACLCACMPSPTSQIALPEAWVFSDLPFTKSDTGGLIARAEKLLAKLEKGGASKEDVSAFEALEAEFATAYSRCAQAYVLRCQDMTNAAWDSAYTDLENDLNEADALLTSIAATLLLAEGSDFLTGWSTQKKELYQRASKLCAPVITEDLKRETALVNAYDKLESGFTVRYAEQEWTIADILATDALSYSELLALLDMYQSEFNKAAGSIFYELVLLRREMAQKMGYESYAQYRYDAYRRDYTPAEADALCTAVKQLFVPLYSALVKQYVNDLNYLYGAKFSQSLYWERIQSAVAQAFPQLVPAWTYMEDHELFDLRVEQNKRAGSYTTYISEYQAPFLYTHWNDSAASVGTVIHEFGHFANSYFSRAQTEMSADSLDLCEVDSQGLELLLLPYYDTVYGRHAQAAAIGNLTDALFAVISGCMEDEFERKVYDASDPMTLAEMNGLYADLARQYGLADLYGYTGTEWMEIPHHYQAPFYYISYATSMLAALGLWETAQGNLPAAQAAYLEILQRKPYATFRKTLIIAGQCDPISPARVQELANCLEMTLQETAG